MDGFLDGGTMQVATDQGDFYVNGRLDSGNRADIYPCYPTDGEMFPNQSEIRTTLVMALTAWDAPKEWKAATEKLIIRLS